MFETIRFIADDRGGLGIDRLFLIAGVALMLGMIAYEVLEAGFGSRVASADSSRETQMAGLEVETGQSVTR